MRITHLKVFVANPGHKVSWGTGWGKNTVLVKVYTEAGIDGLGEAFHSLDEPIEAALLKFERGLQGQDPTRILHNWQAVYRGLRYPLGTAELAARNVGQKLAARHPVAAVQRWPAERDERIDRHRYEQEAAGE